MTNGLGRFGPKPVDVKKVRLQPPLDKIVQSEVAKLKISQYYYDEPLFDEYEATTVRANWDFEAAESIVKEGDNVIDMGCGDGRLLLNLANKIELGDSIGIDISDVAISRFKSNIPQSQKTYIHAMVGDIFNLPSDIKSRRFNVVTFGDATINFILDDDKLEQLLASAKKLLLDESSLIMVAVFGDGTPESLSFMDKRCTVVPFRRSNGISTLIWWAYKYDAEKLIMHRSVFAQSGWSQNGDIEGVVCDLRDKMWTPSSIKPIAERVGLIVDTVVLSKVQDGTAVGMPTAIVTFRQAS